MSRAHSYHAFLHLLALASFALLPTCLVAQAKQSPTIEEVNAAPAGYEGKTLVFRAVEVSGKFVSGPQWCRLSVKSKDGMLINSSLRDTGITFVVPKDMQLGVTKDLQPDRYYSATLTCTIERARNRNHWLARVVKVDFKGRTRAETSATHDDKDSSAKNPHEPSSQTSGATNQKTKNDGQGAEGAQKNKAMREKSKEEIGWQIEEERATVLVLQSRIEDAQKGWASWHRFLRQQEQLVKTSVPRPDLDRILRHFQDGEREAKDKLEALRKEKEAHLAKITELQGEYRLARSADEVQREYWKAHPDELEKAQRQWEEDKKKTLEALRQWEAKDRKDKKRQISGRDGD